MLRQAPKNQALPMSLLLKRGGCTLLTIWLMLAAAAAPAATQPREALMQSIDDGRRILMDPAYQPADRKPLQQEKLRDLLYRDFDFTEFSRRVLANKWALFSPVQRQEFVQVFSRFLADFYLSRLQQRYTDETVAVREQTVTAPGKARVRAAVVWQAREFPVEIYLHDRGYGWKIYDLSALGISAVQIYRAQFQEILRTRSPAEVIELIKARLEE
jgi:phospholipid transport system substrate-binding protein